MRKIFALAILGCFFLSSCRSNAKDIGAAAETQFTTSQENESSTTALTAEEFISAAEKTTTKSAVIAKDKEFEVVELLSEFAIQPRRLGEKGHKMAEEFIAAKLKEYGWNVTEEEFPVYRYKDVISEPYNLKSNDGSVMGSGVNIVAEQPEYDDEKPTLILSAHYDTTKDNIGIIDNGSGTAFLISAAELLSGAELSFNIRLVFFDMEEHSMYGSKYYLENMTVKERDNIIANINFDMVGGSSEGLCIATSNGLESALGIYLNEILGDKYGLSPKGMHSDSNAFMHWQIPAVTFIDESLPLDPVESSEYVDLLSDKAFNDILSDLVLVVNDFDEKAFEKIRNSNIITKYADVQGLNSFIDIYDKMTSLNVDGFELNRCYSKVYDNGISSCFCCEYLNSDGRKFSIETLSEITPDDKTELLNGIPGFEDCKAAAVGDEILVDKMQNYRVIGNLSDDELKIIWSYLR